MIKLEMHDLSSTILYIQLYDGVSISKSDCGNRFFIELAFQVCSPAEHRRELAYGPSRAMRDEDYNMIISEIDKYLNPVPNTNNEALSVPEDPVTCEILENVIDAAIKGGIVKEDEITNGSRTS